MPRRGLQNSHHGCLQCKRRGVKCDEKRPTCAKCERRLDPCRYTSSGPWLWTKPTVAGHNPTEYSEVVPSSRPPTRADCGIGIDLLSISAVLPTGPLDHLSLVLLRNWTTRTATTLARNDTDRRIWQIEIPRRALSNPCLLHGVFAVSAIHLALVPAKSLERDQLIKAAECHQSEAIASLSHLLERNPQSQNIEDFFLSTLLIGFAFAFPLAFSLPDHGPSDPLDEIIQIIWFVKSTMKYSAPLLTGANSQEMIQLTHLEDSSPYMLQPSCSAISALNALNNTRIQSQEDHQTFRKVINLLRDLFAEIDSGAEPTSKAFMWMCEIPSQFCSLLQQRHPFALVIFAHYCVTLHHLRRIWWVSSWGQRVLTVIDRSLTPDWKHSIEWVLNVAGS